MTRSRFAYITGIILWASICIALLMSAVQAFSDTYDDDKLLEFYWDAASGNVSHYNVYLSVDGNDYFLVGQTPTGNAPTQNAPYAIDTTPWNRTAYRIKVEAEDANGITGPMSEPSDPACCIPRSPGDEGSYAGDANGDLKVSATDWAILCRAWETTPADSLFDYKADLNYDQLVNGLDLSIIEYSWGTVYDGGGVSSSTMLEPQRISSIYTRRDSASRKRQRIDRRR